LVSFADMRGVSWVGLMKLRGTVENTAMARRALGPSATPRTVASLSNYFSRVINGRVQKVSAQVLGQIALGLGYKSMSSFYADWERTTADKPARHRPRPAHGAAAPPEPFMQGFTKSVDTLSSNLRKSGITERDGKGRSKDEVETLARQLHAFAETCAALGDTLARESNAAARRPRPAVEGRDRPRSRTRARR